jgi:hypothetical protein
VDGQDTASLAAKLEAVFSSLREVWRAGKDSIRSHFGSGARWANQPYNDDELMAEAFRQVEHCLGAPEFQPSALDALQTLRSSAIAEKVSRRAGLPAPTHRFFDLCEELARAEEHYVIGLRLQAFRYVEQELPRRKDELKIQFFDDLLRRVHGALTRTARPLVLPPAIGPARFTEPRCPGSVNLAGLQVERDSIFPFRISGRDFFVEHVLEHEGGVTRERVAVAPGAGLDMENRVAGLDRLIKSHLAGQFTLRTVSQ